MTKKRTEIRLNLRFKNQELRDDLQIHAHSQGLTLPAWAKATLERELMAASSDAIIARRSRESVLTLHKLMERTHQPEDFSAARKSAQNFIQQVEKHVE